MFKKANSYIIILLLFVVFINTIASETFWHITDTHADWLYKEGSNPNVL